MQKTELKIYSNNVYYDVDLFDNEPITLVKTITELANPETRKSDYTKTINAPGTANNNQIFSNIFDVNHIIQNSGLVNYAPDFNPNLKANCILYRDGIPQIRGYLQLTSINILDEKNVTYELVVYGRTANLFQDIGEKLISDYDYSKYNHVWNKDNIQNSLATSIYINGVTALFQLGRGYVYPLIDYGYDINQSTYEIENMYPAVYAKTILDTIFEHHGYRYESSILTNNFLKSTIFRSLIIPFSGTKFVQSKDEIYDKSFLVSQSVNNYLGAATLNAVKLYFNTTDKDTIPSGVAVNHSSWVVPTGGGGLYRFYSNNLVQFEYTGPLSDIQFDFSIYIVTNTGRYLNSNSSQKVYQVFGFTTFNSQNNFSTDEVLLADGEEVYIQWQVKNVYSPASAVWGTPADIQLTILPGTTFYNIPKSEYSENSLLNIGNALPEIKAKDFLTSLIKMFNLYIEPNQLDDKLLKIEPRDVFYTNNVVDFTDKLDVSKDIVLKPMGALDFKQLEMGYLNDEDYLNKDYIDLFKYNFGYRIENINNDFLNETKKIELVFAPTPIQDNDGQSSRIIPQIVYFKDLTSKTRQDKQSKPRILYYGGIKATTNLTLNSRSGTKYSVTTYGYSGNVDDPITPNIDLNFALPKRLYYGTGSQTGVTINNLYKRYWEKNISEITDKDSKILSCSIYLNNVELQNINFSNLYLIDRQYYRLHKIETDLNSNEPAKCEFLKLKNVNVELADIVYVNGGSQTIGGERYTPIPNASTMLPKLDKIQNYNVESSNQQGADIYLDNRSQFIVVDKDVYLPPPSASYDFDSNKSIEIRIFNNHGGSIKIKRNGSDITLTSKKGITFYTDGDNWFGFD